MFCHPTLFVGHPAGDAKRETFFSQQRVAAVAGADAPDQFFLRKVKDEAALGVQVGEGMKSGNEIIGVAEPLERGLAHAGHDAHAGGDIGAVCNFDSYFAVGRTHGAQNVRDHIHRAAFHGAFKERAHFFLGFGRSHPIVGGAGVGFLPRANEGEVLGTGDVIWITAMKVAMRVGLLIQLDEGAISEHVRGEAVIFRLRSVAPYNF